MNAIYMLIGSLVTAAVTLGATVKPDWGVLVIPAVILAALAMISENT